MTPGSIILNKTRPSDWGGLINLKRNKTRQQLSGLLIFRPKYEPTGWIFYALYIIYIVLVYYKN